MLRFLCFSSVKIFLLMGFSGICYGSIMHFTELPLKDPIERGYSSDLLDALAIPSIDVSGVVTDMEGEPLVGVNIHIKGTTDGTSTDIDGYYELKDVDESAILVFTYIGYKS